MSDKELYKILESFNSVTREDANPYKEVVDEEELNARRVAEVEGLSEEQLDEILPIVGAALGGLGRMAAGAIGGLAKAGATAAGTALGNAAADKVFGTDESVEEAHPSQDRHIDPNNGEFTLDVYGTDRDGGEEEFEIDFTLKNGQIANIDWPDETDFMPEREVYWDEADIIQQIKDAVADGYHLQPTAHQQNQSRIAKQMQQHAAKQAGAKEGIGENQGTKIEKMGNKVIVTAPTGEKTEFDDEETAAAFMGGEVEESVNEDWGSSDWYSVIKSMDEYIDKYGLSPDRIREAARNAAEFWGDMMGHDMSTRDGEQEAIDDCIGGWMRMSERGQKLQQMFAPRESVEEEIEDVNESEQVDEIAPIVGAMLGTGARAAGAAFGAGAAEKLFADAELSTFDPEDANHRKRLQRGTPIVLSPELFADPEVDRRAIFISLAPSGQFCKALRQSDGREVNCHLSDIMSADILNNSIYEQYNIDFEALMEDELNEDITITQTTNPDAPENDTITVTGIGPDAIDELDAIMQNAGIKRDYEAPRDAGVDDGMPVSDKPVYMEPETLSAGAGCKEGFDADGWNDTYGVHIDDAELNDFDPVTGVNSAGVHIDDAEAAIAEDPQTLKGLSLATAANILNGHTDVADIVFGHDKEIPQKDRELISREFSELTNSNPGAGENEHVQDITNMIYDLFSDDVEDYYIDMPDREKMSYESRDIEHANTPDERVAGVKAVTHGTSGGLNKPKQMFKKEYPGDNPMAVEDEELAEKAPPGMEDWIKDRKEAFKDQYGDRWEEVLYATAWKEHNKKNEDAKLRPGAALDETESFLNLFKEFQMRGEKRK